MTQSPFSLEGKTIIVTGGGIGIGKSISIECARAGADIMLCSRRMEHLEPTAEAIRGLGKRALALTVDVRDPTRCTSGGSVRWRNLARLTCSSTITVPAFVPQ